VFVCLFVTFPFRDFVVLNKRMYVGRNTQSGYGRKRQSLFQGSVVPLD
jgi:hypothetical protein